MGRSPQTLGDLRGRGAHRRQGASRDRADSLLRRRRTRRRRCGATSRWRSGCRCSGSADTSGKGSGLRSRASRRCCTHGRTCPRCRWICRQSIDVGCRLRRRRCDAVRSPPPGSRDDRRRRPCPSFVAGAWRGPLRAARSRSLERRSRRCRHPSDPGVPGRSLVPASQFLQRPQMREAARNRPAVSRRSGRAPAP